ncbi:MAG: hypothetical protein ACO2OZ_01625 [Acidilobaceae archaeon]
MVQAVQSLNTSWKVFTNQCFKTIRRLFVDCSMASSSLMETGNKELQELLGLYRNKEILKNPGELA